MYQVSLLLKGLCLTFSPEHPCVLHDRDSELLPRQFSPPPEGGGLLQVRMRVCEPPPHVTLQPLHVPQLDQPPLT